MTILATNYVPLNTHASLSLESAQRILARHSIVSITEGTTLYALDKSGSFVADGKFIPRYQWQRVTLDLEWLLAWVNRKPATRR